VEEKASRYVLNALNKQSQSADKGWSSAEILVRVLITSLCKRNTACHEMLHVMTRVTKLMCDLKLGGKLDLGMWIGFIWLSIGTSGRLL
jgi:hypothetical protein